jgi:hypothetical protein
MNEWQTFCEGLAALPAETLLPGDIGWRLTPAILRLWRDWQPRNSHEIVGRALTDIRSHDANLMLEAAMSDGDSTVPQWVMRDALRQCAIADALSAAKAIREKRGHLKGVVRALHVPDQTNGGQC